MFTPLILVKAEQVLHAAQARGLLLATAESCTGGLVAGCLTEIAGSSAAIDRGFVTYSNAAKMDLLGVPTALLAQHGAVSAPVARSMAQGAIAQSKADVAVAITGIAGPGGATPDKPVGLVHFAIATRLGATTDRCMTFGNIGRSEVRLASVETALDLLLAALAPD
jgi:nicotinamide-nucleotide amidase